MKAEMTEIVMPGDANHLGTCFGGKIMSWIDTVAAIAANRVVGTVVTASVDSIEFKKPIKVGDIVTLQAHINRVWNSSMEVGVRVMVQRPSPKIKYGYGKAQDVVYFGVSEPEQACRAYLTFVGVDENGHRRDVSEDVDFWEEAHPEFISHMLPDVMEVPKQTRRFEEAGKRREIRLANRKK